MSTTGERIWNGPFYASTVPVPVTIGWVLLKTLETLWRAMVIVVGVAIAVGAFAWLNNKDEVPLQKNVSASLTLNAIECKKTPNFPVALTFYNNSKITVGSISIAYHAYAEGQSTDLAASDQNARTLFDGVIQPNAWIYYCIGLPALSQESQAAVRYSVEVVSAEPTEKAYETGQKGAIWSRPPVTKQPIAPTPVAEPVSDIAAGRAAIAFPAQFGRVAKRIEKSPAERRE